MAPSAPGRWATLPLAWRLARSRTDHVTSGAARRPDDRRRDELRTEAGREQEAVHVDDVEAGVGDRTLGVAVGTGADAAAARARSRRYGSGSTATTSVTDDG
jgi:hypothetical protein